MYHDLICVSVESPLRAGPNHADEFLLRRNVEYAKLACQDSIMRGESPYASHLFFPQFMDEADLASRIAALTMSHSWRLRADLIAFYVDFGMSSGMKDAEELAMTNGIQTERRQISAEAMAALEEILANADVTAVGGGTAALSIEGENGGRSSSIHHNIQDAAGYGSDRPAQSGGESSAVGGE